MNQQDIQSTIPENFRQRAKDENLEKSRYARLKLLYSATPIVIILSLLIAAAVFFLTDSSHDQSLYLWVGAVLATDIWLALQYVLFIRAGNTIDRVNTWQASFFASLIVMALIFGATAFVTTQAGTGLAIAGIAATSLFVAVTPSLASNMIMAIGFSTAALAPFLAQLFLQGHNLATYVAISLASLTVGLLLATRRIQQDANDSMQLGDDNSNLIKYLSESKTHAEKLNAELTEEIRQRSNIENELKLAKRTSESANLAKDEFLATMSHEIRTPLNGILPLLDMLADTGLDADQMDFLGTAIESSNHLLRIIDDILDYSKIEAGKLELEVVGINIGEIVQSVTELMGRSAESKNLDLRWSIDPNVRKNMRGDPVRLRQILSNLVSNAIKFTEKGQVHIKVSLHQSEQTHDELLFAIQDTGIGMDAETSKRLFKAFSQADASTTRIHGGTGLGLVICKRLVDLMNGKIGVKSKQGKGSIFWFAVPLLKAAGDMAPGRRSLNGTRALLLLPDPSDFQKASTFMDAWGVRITRAEDTSDALSQLQKSAQLGSNWGFELLLVDMATGESQLDALINGIAANHTLTRISIIALASGKLPDLPQRLGINSVLNRPLSEHAMFDQMSEAMGITGGTIQSTSRTRPHRPGVPAGQQAEIQIQGSSDPKAGTQLETPPPTAKSAPDTNTGSSSGHVLLVEDNMVNLKVAQKLVERAGLTYDTATNGKIAVEKIQRKRYSMVFMDCQMPVMDGYRATAAIRAHEVELGYRTPIVAMTANAMAGDREKCIAAGMDDYLSKPLNRNKLTSTITKWSSRATTERRPANSFKKPAKRPLEKKPEPPPGPDRAIDKQIVADLMEVMGDEFIELLEIYLQDTPKSLSSLKKAAHQYDIPGLVGPAHSIKSTSANVGAMALSEVAKEIELSARQAAISNPSEMVEKALRLYQSAANELQGMMK